MGKTYLVTGGAGFVGIAVLKLLAKESPERVSHVKVVDLRIPQDLKNAVQVYPNGPTFEWIICDITNQSQVFEAMKGCDIVLHLASVIPGAAKDNRDLMWKVNVTGTKNIVDACCKCNVRALVYTSSVMTVGPNSARDPADNLEENSLYNSHPLSFYGETKKAAESYALGANGRKGKDGKTLVTCSLRPFIIYGQQFVALRDFYKGGQHTKTIFSLHNAESKVSSIYVGNLAHSIITAAQNMEDKANLVGGQAYFMTDDTPPMQFYNIFTKLFAVLGYKCSRQPVLPFFLVYTIYWLMHWFSRITGISFKVQLPEPDYIWRTNTRFILSNEKFSKHFGYKPEFSLEHAYAKTGEYILRLDKNRFQEPIYDFEY